MVVFGCVHTSQGMTECDILKLQGKGAPEASSLGLMLSSTVLAMEELFSTSKESKHSLEVGCA